MGLRASRWIVSIFAIFAIVVIVTSITRVASAQQPPPPKPAQPAPPTGGGASGTPSEANIEEARKHYNLALELFADGAVEPACIEFERAYDLAPSYKILYNIGICYRQANNYVRAINALKRYLDEAGEGINAERRTEVNKSLLELRARTATIDIRTEAGAQVTIDDEPVGDAPLGGPVLVNPGRRKLGATIQGKNPASTVVTIAAGEAQKVTLTFNAAPGGGPPPPPPPRSTVPWITAGAGAALMAAGGVTGILALNKVGKLKDICTPKCPADNPDYSAQRDSAHTFVTITDYLLIGGGALVVTGAVWLIARGSGSSEKPAERGTSAQMMCTSTGCFGALQRSF